MPMLVWLEIIGLNACSCLENDIRCAEIVDQETIIKATIDRRHRARAATDVVIYSCRFCVSAGGLHQKARLNLDAHACVLASHISSY